jgi:activating signal cointegrator complex subunit 3
MDKLVRATAIESNFVKQLADHLNAEVVGGTVTSIKEGATWLTYTYLYTRMLRNPLAYGINADEKADDPMLKRRCDKLIIDAARLLDQNQMIRYNADSGNLAVAQKGKVAAHFYIQAESIATFNEMFAGGLQVTDGFLIKMVCAATEFRSMKVRQEELSELGALHNNDCPIKLQGAGLDDAGNSLVTGPADKAFILVQCFISRSKIKGFTLISDMNYVASNVG